MKATLNEYESCFGVTFKPETLEEAALLSRMSLNALTDVRSCETYLGSDAFTTYLVVGKSKKPDSSIRRKTS